MKLLGLAGAAGSGKSTVARHLVECFGFVPLSLADYFKIPLVAAGSITREEAFTSAPRSALARGMMQAAGTELGRDIYGDDHWIRHLKAHLFRLASAGVKCAVVDDVRFLNEGEAIRRWGGELWGLTGRSASMPGVTGSHRSELDIGELTRSCDRIFDNSGEMDWSVIDRWADRDFGVLRELVNG